jgi:putative transposase
MQSEYDPKIHSRRSIRLREYDYSQNGYYYVTICTRDRKCWFGNVVNGKMKLSGIGEIVKQCWDTIQQHFDDVILDEMVIMPNHLHGIIVINGNNGQPYNALCCRGLINQTPTTTKWILQKTQNMVLGKIIRFFKARSCRLIHMNGFNEFQWQRNYYEHIIRNDDELYMIRKYIINNPLRFD